MDATNVAEGSRIHKILSKEHKNKIGSLRKPDGTHTINEKETLELLNKVHFPGSVSIANSSRNDVLNSTSNRLNFESAQKIFTEEKIRWSVNSFSAFKYPGLVAIFPALLQKGIELLLPYIKNLYAYSYVWSYIPNVGEM